MKSILKKVAGLAVTAALALGMMSCEQNVDTHEHTFAIEWTSDATHHWHSATCEHTTEVKDKAAHIFGEWNITLQPTEETEGSKERECSVCAYKETEVIAKLEHTHTFATEWTTSETHHWHAATCGHTAEVKDKAEHTFGEYVSNNDATTDANGTKTRTCSVCGYADTVTDEGSKIIVIVPECVKVIGGTVTGAAYTDNFTGVFPEGRTVTLSSFYMGKYEVTQAQYKSVMAGQKVTVDGTEYTLADSPSYCVQGSTDCKVDSDKDHANYPVENVTWFDAVYYCNALSTKENLAPCYTITVTKVSSGHITAATVEYDKTKNGYRLPTEAEWEYAARGGDPAKADWNYTFSGANKAEGTLYNDEKNAGLDSVGWYCYNNITGTTGDTDVTYSAEGQGTHEVGKKNANALVIYDMSGNVWEWCYDGYGRTSNETVTDPAGASSGDYRVIRGGGWFSNADIASVSRRSNYLPVFQSYYLGFRVVRNAN